MKLLTIILTFGFLTNLYGQTNPKLETILKKDFSENSTEPGKWVFYSDNANMEKIDKPLIKSVIPNYDFYKVTMTNFLGYHIDKGTCLVLVDSSKSKTVLVEPLWYAGASKTLLKIFIGHKFDSKESLLNFMTQLNALMEIDSKYKFRRTSVTDTLITYDLGYFKGDSYTAGGNELNSTVNYKENSVWRKITIEIKDCVIIRFVVINPKRNDREIVE